MATLILSAVGSAVGGPIGGAIGAIVGQVADQAIFAPKARHGPRLGELAVQTSTYGTAIPKIFGTMRVAGTVIWSTDLIERRSSSGGGKGRPRTVAYSYSASFAVALSARKVRDVHRIWADGKLLRGAAGDFKSATGFRLYSGDEDQAADPLIAAAEGIDQAPAFRGTAYAVFEDFQLEDFGNRIPSLTFEVEADPGRITIGSIAAELSGGSIVDGGTDELSGYAATGDSVRGAVQALSDVLALPLVDRGESLLLGGAAAAATVLEDRDRTADFEIARQAAGIIPAEVSISYYEPERDYQTGLQRAVRPGAGGGRRAEQAIAASLSAEAAKSFAERRLATLWARRASAKVELGWRHLELKPGAIARLADRTWRVDRWVLGPMTVALELSGVSPSGAPDALASPGRSTGEQDLVHGPTTIRLLDVPISSGLDRSHLFVLAAGTMPGWRRASLLASFDDGATWLEAGATAQPAVMGHVRTVLPPSGSALVDESNSVVVELLHDAMWLEARDDTALAGGANLALLGSELIQFGAVDALGEKRFRLSKLLRGRRGTEWASASHVEHEQFALIDAEALVPLDVPAVAVGTDARVIATGIGDGPEGVSAIRHLTGEGLRPPAPVHLAADTSVDGDIAIAWVRRSRQGWTWLSGADTPLGEEQEKYRVTISGAGSTRSVETGEARYVYTSGLRAADGNGGPLSIAVTQLGTYAASRPAVLTVD